jgi:thiamine-phosphate pyrophosphorylase
MIKGYYFITDLKLSKSGNLSDVKNAVKAGVSVVQYRNKTGSSKKMYEEAMQLKKICRDIIFIVNDRIDIALAVDADGVHLGQNDMPYNVARKLLGNKIIGATVHDINQAFQAEKDGANYLGVAPIFATTTKTDAGKPCGVSLIKEIKKRCKIPIVAVGGINHENICAVVAAGADAVCAISAVVGKENVFNEIKNIQKLFYKS